jgi:hypothetical protein
MARLCYTARLASTRWDSLRRRFYGPPAVPRIAEPEIDAAATWLASLSELGKTAPADRAANDYLDRMRRGAIVANRVAEETGRPPEIGIADEVFDGMGRGIARVAVRPGRCYGFLPTSSIAAFVWPGSDAGATREG